ncbi:MAG: KamA family radical SAM protein, partial [Spirochaetales bacterium]|nr:KamA family radical SAM protein [Spirochaetales bacterium]
MIHYNEQYEDNRHRLFPNVSDEQWLDYRWQLKNRITDRDALNALLGTNFIFSDEFRFALTPHLLALINSTDSQNGIIRQVIPNDKEFNKSETLTIDPFDEQVKSPVWRLVKRYPDRILVLTTNMCPSYCRYCTRKWNWTDTFTITKEEIDSAADYVKFNRNIREVIISGGEPMLLPAEMLDYMLSTFSQIDNVENIRIASRSLTFCPMLITTEKTDIMKKYKPLWFITHFNHPDEFSRIADEKVEMLQEAHVALANQSVLLRGVNDDVQTMKTLLTRLETFRIKPYYLFQCDLVDGTNHFRCDYRLGMELIDTLQGDIG